MSFFHDHDDDDGGTIERTSSSHVHSCASRPENLNVWNKSEHLFGCSVASDLRRSTFKRCCECHYPPKNSTLIRQVYTYIAFSWSHPSRPRKTGNNEVYRLQRREEERGEAAIRLTGADIHNLPTSIFRFRRSIPPPPPPPPPPTIPHPHGPLSFVRSFPLLTIRVIPAT